MCDFVSCVRLKKLTKHAVQRIYMDGPVAQLIRGYTAISITAYRYRGSWMTNGAAIKHIFYVGSYTNRCHLYLYVFGVSCVQTAKIANSKYGFIAKAYKRK